jgi:hypothetical protein
LFSWVRLKATELTPLGKLGLNVIRNDPRQRGFTQPCPMWNGACKIYHSYHYPRGCESYKCKLLRELLDESVELDQALRVVRQAQAKIRSVEKILPPSKEKSFRERVVEQLEQLRLATKLTAVEANVRTQANSLLDFFDSNFGVNDFRQGAVSE